MVASNAPAAAAVKQQTPVKKACTPRVQANRGPTGEIKILESNVPAKVEAEMRSPYSYENIIRRSQPCASSLINIKIKLNEETKERQALKGLQAPVVYSVEKKPYTNSRPDTVEKYT